MSAEDRPPRIDWNSRPFAVETGENCCAFSTNAGQKPPHPTRRREIADLELREKVRLSLMSGHVNSKPPLLNKERFFYLFCRVELDLLRWRPAAWPEYSSAVELACRNS